MYMDLHLKRGTTPPFMPGKSPGTKGVLCGNYWPFFT